MHTRRSISLMLALVLAFPPGWCCTGVSIASCLTKGAGAGKNVAGKRAAGKSSSEQLQVAQTHAGDSVGQGQSAGSDTPLSPCCRGKQSSPTRPGKAPVRSAVRCCCLWDAVRSQTTVVERLTASVYLPADASHGCGLECGVCAVLDGISQFDASGPPVRLLQCVWLC